MAQTILYYPKINIQDGTWLRNALLYWDEVSSIVPYENFADLSPELLYLQKLGIYHAVYPQELFFSDFSEDFCNCIIRRIETYERAVTENSSAIQSERVMIHKNKMYAPALRELIHYKKLPSNLLSIFEEKKFINDLNAGGWIEIDSQIGRIYMRTLAEYSIKCSNKDIVLGTDTVTHNREIYRNAFNRTDISKQCCKINIEKCLPQPAMDVSFDDILHFKNRRKDEFDAFRAKIRELETQIYHADSLEMIKHYEEKFIEGWKQCSNDFYRVLKEEKIKFYLSSLVSLVALPFVGQLLSEGVNSTVSSVIQNAAPMINIGIGYFDYRNKISPAKTDGGFSYIIKANRDGIIHI